MNSNSLIYRGILPAIIWVGSLGSVLCQAQVSFFSKADVERDLNLEMRLKSTSVILPGMRAEVEFIVKNLSKTTTYPLPYCYEPDKGRVQSRYEILVDYSGIFQTKDGVTKPWKPNLECGNSWLESLPKKTSVELVHLLKPNEEFILNTSLKIWHELQHSPFSPEGKITLVAYCRFPSGHKNQITFGDAIPLLEMFDRPKTQRPPGVLAGLPQFELTSKPLQFEFVTPKPKLVSELLALKVVVKKEMIVGVKTKLSDLFDVKLENHSNTPMTFDSVGSDRPFTWEIAGKFGAWPYPEINVVDTLVDDKSVMIKLGEDFSVMANNSPEMGLNGVWTYPSVDTVKVRVRYQSGNSSLYSDWVKIKVTEAKQQVTPK